MQSVIWFQYAKNDIIAWIWIDNTSHVCITATSYEHRGVKSHRQIDHYFNSLLRLTAMKTSKLIITGPSWGKSTCDWTGVWPNRHSNLQKHFWKDIWNNVWCFAMACTNANITILHNFISLQQRHMSIILPQITGSCWTVVSIACLG